MKFMGSLKKNKKIINITICALCIFILLVFLSSSSSTSLSLETIAVKTNESREFVYLSDLNFITEGGLSYNGWSGHEIQIDKNQDGGSISVIVDDEKRVYNKGISIHAKGQVVYDISAFSTDYTRFTAKLGLEASKTTGSIWFEIFVSNDRTTWTSLLKTDTLTNTTPAVDVDLNIEGYKYLKIYVDPAGANTSDHGNIAGAKLVTKDYINDGVYYDKLHPVDYYDEILREHDAEYNYSNNYRLILEREFVNKLGFWNIQNKAELSTDMVELFDWMLSDNRIIEEVIEVGEISNSTKFLTVIFDIYQKYKNELNSSNGYVYEKMMIALAAGYSTDKIISPLEFSFPSPTYDYLERFEIMKNLFDNNKLKIVKNNDMQGEFVDNNWFKDYHVELMRMVMQDGTSNGDLVWLNGFTYEKKSVSFYMIGYVSPVYTQDKYYAEENREKYDQQFYLSKYNVPYGLINGKKIPRYWMVFANGGICWNASRVGQSMYRVNGVPATGAYQVGHELYIQYYEDANGNGYWSPRYGNWIGAGSTWGGGNPFRYIFNWNNKYFTDKHISGSKVASSTGYLYLGQANLNRYEDYQKSLYLNLTANSFTDDNKKLETYFKSLEVNNINLDSYDYIINIYKKMSVNNEGGTITSTDWYNLANKIIEAYTYHPVAMFDLLKVIRPYLDGSEKLHIDRLEKDALEKASAATSNETIQVDAVRTHARQLLNKAQPDPMSFSFDGENAGKIVRNPIYQFAWAYSLDGGATFTEFLNDDIFELTKEEIAKITAENDIIFKFMGLTDYRYTIDITEGVLNNNLFANDLENRVIGIDLTYEWRDSESDPWTSYRISSPDNTGNKTLYVRRGSTGTQLATESVTYTFTPDNQPDTRKYVSVSHLTIEDVSTEATSNGGAALYAIDGNYNTRWHSAWNGSDTERFITIKLDKPRFVSAVEYVPAGGGNGRINDGTVWGSMDGENWEILSQRRGITYSSQANTNEEAVKLTQKFEVDNPKEVQYIKIVADRTNGNWFAARAFNIFQDLTKNLRPTAGVGYSTTEPTNGSVVARLLNVSSANFEILSEGGDTHTFTENGEFTFRFVDKETGLEGSSVAKVDWIDKTAPTATFEFTPNSPTNGSVIAKLKPNEKVTVTNNGIFTVDEEGNIYNVDGIMIPGLKADENGDVWDDDGNYVTNINPFTYEFLSNGEFTFEFVDTAGNRGTATAKVDWIDHEAPKATLSYSKDTLTNQDVIVTIDFDEEAIVTNNNGSRTYAFKENGEFIFEFRDLAGNTGQITARVDCIDKVAPTAELKYEKIDDKVIVRVVNPSEEITFKEGIGVYEFTKNGTYEIIFYDKAGNVGKLTAVIKDFEDDNDGTDEKPTDPDNPVNPDNPSEPSDPSNPGNPSDPSNPVNPDDSNKPDKPTGPSNPSDPGNSNKPSNPNNPGNSGSTGGNNKPSNPGNSDNNPDNNGDVTNPINKEYEKYNIRNVLVEIPKNIMQDGYSVIAPDFELSSELRGKFGKDSEYYDIHILDQNASRLDITSQSPMKISIALKKTKRFLGVYEITDDNNIKLIDYERNGDNIEILTNKLGKYVVSYKELEIVQPDIKIPVVKEENNVVVPIVIALTGVFIVGMILYISKKK